MIYYKDNGALVCSPDTSIEEAMSWLQKHPVNGAVVVVDEEMLLKGLATRRDLRYETRLKAPISSVMTPYVRLVTAIEDTSEAEIRGLLSKHRIDKVLVVDRDFHYKQIIYSDFLQDPADPLRKHDAAQIIRSIEFEPEHYQAGVSILTYFGNVLRDKYHDEQVSFTVSQDNLTVKLRIETPAGKIEEIEKCLLDFGKVVAGTLQLHEFLQDPIQALAMQNKLQTAQLELAQTKQLLEFSHLTTKHQEQRVQSLEGEVSWLRRQVGRLISTSLDKQNTLSHALETLETNASATSQQALLILKKALQDGLKEGDADVVRKALTDIKEDDPGLLGKLHTLIIEGAISGTSGNILYSWLLPIINSLPK
jgi:hypothetical protein